MNKVVSLVDRKTGRSRSFHVTDDLNMDTISASCSRTFAARAAC
jgi:hypothetical protein